MLGVYNIIRTIDFKKGKLFNKSHYNIVIIIIIIALQNAHERGKEGRYKVDCDKRSF